MGGGRLAFAFGLGFGVTTAADDDGLERLVRDAEGEIARLLREDVGGDMVRVIDEPYEEEEEFMFVFTGRPEVVVEEEEDIERPRVFVDDGGELGGENELMSEA